MSGRGAPFDTPAAPQDERARATLRLRVLQIARMLQALESHATLRLAGLTLALIAFLFLAVVIVPSCIEILKEHA
jgi:hypothetical protein